MKNYTIVYLTTIGFMAVCQPSSLLYGAYTIYTRQPVKGWTMAQVIHIYNSII